MCASCERFFSGRVGRKNEIEGIARDTRATTAGMVVVDRPDKSDVENGRVLAHSLAGLFGAQIEPQGSNTIMSLVRARAEFFDFSKLCAVVAISRCSSISRFFRGPRRSRFDVLECTPVLLPLTPGSSNAREPLLFPLIASRCREDGIVWFFIRQLILVPTPARAKLRRRAGIPSSRSCARSPGRGCGCTNTGVIARRILIGPTRSIPGTPKSSKD